ncbi:MAG: hypothetical protein WD469_02870 [Paenibacillaceae bacterium]
MKAEFFLDLCFIRTHVENKVFINLIEEQLKPLFADKGNWSVNCRREGPLNIVLAEIQGIWNWENEEMIFAYMEEEASPLFWEWLQGCQIELDLKEEVEYSYCRMK